MGRSWIYASSIVLGTASSAIIAIACADKGGFDATPASAGAAGRVAASGDGGVGEAGLTPGNAGALSSSAGGSTGGATGTSGADGSGGNGESAATGSDSGGAGVSGGGLGSAAAPNSGERAGAGGTAGSGGAPDAGPIPTSDTFDGTTLDASWTVFRSELAEIAISDGSLSIAPRSGALWYQASQGDLIYKLVSGNFKATTTVHARKASNRALTPAQFADVGGIMARSPSGATENYILGVVGYAEMNQLAVEHKSTKNGQSVYGEVAFSADAEFRLCRVGSTFTIYYRHPGDTSWGPAFAPFERPDLPATVQVGAIAYTGATAPDFIAIFDNFDFEALGAGCTQ